MAENNLTKDNKHSTLLIVLSAWIVSLIITGIQGNFPLNDDWAYARSVRQLLFTGNLELTGWTSMPVITQIYWGYIFTYLLGFSFEVLRYSTILLSIAGLVFTWFTLRDSSKDDKATVLPFLLIIFNPLYYSLSATFMTDVPFYVFFAGGIYFYLRYFRTGHYPNFIAALLLTAAAAFIRQLEAVSLLTFAIIYSFKKDQPFAKKLIPYLLFAVLILAIVIVQDYVKSPVASPFTNNKRVNIFVNFFLIAPWAKIAAAIKTGYFGLLYLGLFLFPLLLFYIREVYRRITFYLMILVSIGILLLLVNGNKILPLRPNMLTLYGVGPVLLKDVDVLGLKHLPVIPWVVWLIITFAGVVGSVVLIFIFLRYVRRFRNKPRALFSEEKLSTTFIILTLLLSYIPICITEFYDRYLLIYLLLTAYLLMNTGIVKPGRLVTKAAYTLTAIIILFSIIGTHDYFAWNKARWEATDYLVYQQRVSEDNIEGGFEFNGWYHYDAKYAGDPNISNWWSSGNDYFISFGDVNGYTKVKTFPYSSWLFMREGNVYILKKDTR